MQDEDNGDGAGDTASEAFICGICPKSLKNKESLRKHKKTHTIEPSTCDVCDKKYNSKSLLNKHRKTVHNDVVYSCDSCNKRFTAVKNLSTCQIYSWEQTWEMFCLWKGS